VEDSSHGLMWCTVSIFSGGAEEKHNASVHIASLRVDIRTRDFSNSKEERYSLDSDFRHEDFCDSP
jgi:hypothetical protein